MKFINAVDETDDTVEIKKPTRKASSKIQVQQLSSPTSPKTPYSMANQAQSPTQPAKRKSSTKLPARKPSRHAELELTSSSSEEIYYDTLGRQWRKVEERRPRRISVHK